MTTVMKRVLSPPGSPPRSPWQRKIARKTKTPVVEGIQLNSHTYSLDLPTELWEVIFQFCCHRQVLKFASVCTMWRSCSDNVLRFYFPLYKCVNAVFKTYRNRFQDTCVLNKFTNLVSLNLAGNPFITSVSALTNLTELDISDSSLITDSCISRLTRLRDLRVSRNSSINGDFLLSCTNLRVLHATETAIEYNKLAQTTSLTSFRGSLNICNILPALSNLKEIFMHPFDDIDSVSLLTTIVTHHLAMHCPGCVNKNVSTYGNVSSLWKRYQANTSNKPPQSRAINFRACAYLRLLQCHVCPHEVKMPSCQTRYHYS